MARGAGKAVAHRMSESNRHVRSTVQLPGLALELHTAAEQIADRILAAIAVGVLYPGERLPSERELASMLGVARNTVREALGRLQALGVLDVRRGRGGGTFVLPLRPSSDGARAVLRTLGPVWDEVELLLDYRNLVEQQISRTAATRREAVHVTAMNAALDQYRRADSAEASREADRLLHGAIAAATGNRHLHRLSQELVTAVNFGFRADPYSGELHRRALVQHEHLVDAVVAGDGERAAHLAAQHFRTTTIEPWQTALGTADGAAAAGAEGPDRSETTGRQPTEA